MYGGPSIPPRPVERTEESRLYPVMTLIAGVIFVLLLIGLVVVLRWLGGAGETADSLRLLGAAR